MLELPALPVHIYALAMVLAALVLGFVAVFLLPGVSLWFRLERLTRRLVVFRDTQGEDPAPLFDVDRTLKHLWREYAHTLHKQVQLNPNTGAYDVIALRATVPAEAFFSLQVLVENRLGTEFFKHLPGIFTGIGIIGTFYGLIRGLQAFQVSEKPDQVRDSLNALLHGVWEAFLVSAFAIAAAMVVTFLEKILLASLHRKVEALTQIIDSLFESGASEEYLSRLVNASEDSASQTKILKDALVADLKQVLTELTERQIAEAASGNARLGQEITGGIEHGLKAPLEQIAAAVGQVSQDQGSAVNRLLTDVLAGFSQRLQELFGGQISGITEMQQQTIAALQAAVVKLEQMASGVESAGRNAADAMGTRLTEALTSLESRQLTMNQQMAEFVQQIRSLIEASQTETGQKLQSLLAELGDKVSAMVGTLREQADRAAAAHAEHEDRVAQRTEHTITQIGGHVDSVVSQVAEATAAMRESIEALRNTTVDALNRMNSGAETLYVAANDFAKAGQGVTGVFTQATGVTGELSRAAGSVAAATRALDGVLSDYKAARDSLSQLLGSAQSVIEAAQRDASLTSETLKQIEDAAGKLAKVQQDAGQYLETVSEVLAHAHREFADNMNRSLREANTQFYESLTTATGLLREGIQELEAVLAVVPAARRA